MTQNEFYHFVDMMDKAKNEQDSMYKDFIGFGVSGLSSAYVKHERLRVNRYMTTKIYVSKWIHPYVLEVKVAIRRDGEKRKGVVPLEHDDIVICRISESIINFKDVEQEAIYMAKKLGWL